MMRSVFTKTLYDKRFFVLGWGIGVLAIAMIMTSFFPAMRPEGGFDALIENIPSAFQGLIGDLADLRNFDTFIASQLFDIRVPLIAGIMAIILALGLSTKEEENGELRTLLSLPISRTKLFLEKWLAMVVIMGVSVLALVAGVYMIMPFIDDAEITGDVMTRLALMTWLVMIVFGSVTYAVGMATGRRAVASMVSITVVIGSFLLSTFAVAVDWLGDFEVLSLLHYFPAADIVRNGIQYSDVAVLSTVSLVSLLAAWLVFRRRDIA